MFRSFSLRDIPPTPWKNGGGLTQEIICWPPGAAMDDFQWRVSVASIRAGGPFSVFPGIDRVIVLLEGDGVCLRSPGQDLDQRLDQRHRPLRFSGDHACDCELLGGGSRDFNVMTRRGSVAAEVQVLWVAATGAGADGLIFAAMGAWSLRTDREMDLKAGSGIVWAEQPVSWAARPLEAGAALIMVKIQPAG